MTPAQRLVISNFSTGFEQDREPFLINNDAFPSLQNAYVWRGKILKKDGTLLLGRLQRYIPGNGTRPHTGTINIAVLDGSGNLAATSLITVFSLQSGANIVPGSINFSDGVNTYTEPGTPNGTLIGVPGGSGTINYATSSITISGGNPAGNLVGSFQYYPNLPVMGIEDFQIQSANQPTPVFFDTVYSYQFDQTNEIFYDTNFYKSTKNSFVWSGQDYQQFWSTNYYGAMWVTNGKPGFHFKNITNVPVTGATTQITIANHGLTTNDYIFVNEVGGVTNINGVSARVNSVVDPNNITIVTPVATGGAYTANGIAQYLTSSSSSTQDGIRWYDGDPTSAAAPNNLGWVNFSPPLSNTSTPDYLVGAVAILPFKDRLLFFSPIVQTSSGAPRILQDRVIYSQNGTPFYTAIVPSGQVSPITTSSTTAFGSSAWWQNIVGFGGFVAAGIQQPIVTVSNNEDVLLVEFPNRKTKLVYTSNDLIPFLFYSINSELGTQSTFSSVTLDTGALSIGQYGLAMTTQNSAQRIDLLIPDQIFQIKKTNFGVNRVCAIRDYRNEFIYFTYPTEQIKYSNFPTQTLVFNYRENNWAVFIENYTTYGNFRKTSETTWEKLTYPSWSSWNDPWNSGKGNTNYPFIAGGNQQGFVLLKDDNGVAEAQSSYIQSITISGSTVTINSPNHCLSTGDYIYIQGCIGVSDINSTIRQITVVDADNFRIDSRQPPAIPSGTYLGGGTFAKLTLPFILTKQFPIFWDQSKKIRIGQQRYLFDETSQGEITVGIYLSQNSNVSADGPPFLPDNNPFNSSVIFTQTVLTRPEPVAIILPNQPLGNIGDGINTTFSINIFTLSTPPISGTIIPGTVVISIGNPGNSTFTDNGEGLFTVTGAAVVAGSSINYNNGDVVMVFNYAINTSLIQVSLQYYPVSQSSSDQSQIWHQMNNSLVGDSVQLGFTLSDTQMRQSNLSIQNSDIVLHAIVLDLYPSGVLGI